MLTVGYEILITYPLWRMNLVMNLVTGSAREAALSLHFLGLCHSDLLGICKKVPATPGVWLSPAQLSTEQHCLCATLT